MTIKPFSECMQSVNSLQVPQQRMIDQLSHSTWQN